MKYLALIFAFLSSSLIFAQQDSVQYWENNQKIFFIEDSIQLDSMMIQNESIKIQNLNGFTISSESYEFNTTNNLIKFKKTFKDSVLVSYKRHKKFNTIAKRINSDIKVLPKIANNELVEYLKKEKKTSQPFDGLQSEGSFVRGISMGNTQSGSVQSSLDLKLEGNLNSKIGIKAAISDNNAPIENNGYTQNLNQFDRIFIELFTNKHRLRAGHIDLDESENTLSKFSRKVTGIQAESNLNLYNGHLKASMAASTSRGTFTQYQFVGSDGNQGPYALRSNQENAVVLILADSEKVYLNGLLLQRGEDQDYTMNYTTGEILFTNKNIIRSTDIILTEFLYTNQNYNRYLVHSTVDYKKKNWRFKASFYTENDIKNSPVNQSFSRDELQLLSESSSDVVYVSSAVETDYTEGIILYEKIIVDNTTYFQYSTDRSTTLYNVDFTEVGEKQGDYVYSNSSTNGNIYEYISPINGISQGNFAPVKRLNAPQKHQVIGLNNTYNYSTFGSVNTQIALSNKNKNLFTKASQKGNYGSAVLIDFKDRVIWLNKTLKPHLSYNYISETFEPLERIRDAQFAREFNLNQETGIGNQHYATLNLPIEWDDSTNLSYTGEVLSNPDYYSGIKHTINALHSSFNWEIKSNASLLNSKQDDNLTQLLRYATDIGKKWKGLTVGIGAIGETNNWKTGNIYNESRSFSWKEYYQYIDIRKSNQSIVKTRIYYRTDDSIQNNEFNNHLKSYGLQTNANIVQTQTRRLTIDANYRYAKKHNQNKPNQFLTTGISAMQNISNGGLVLNLNYTLSGGNDFERAFKYVKVSEGLGIYKWTDYNMDGIEQIDEFEVAEFADQAEYIRVFTNNTQQILTNKNSFTLSARWKPSNFMIQKSNTFKRLLFFGSINTQGNYLKESKIAEFNPFNTSENAKSRNQTIVGQIQYLKSAESKFSSIYEFSLQENFRLIYTGLEKFSQVKNEWTKQYSIHPNLNFIWKNSYNFQKSDSESFESKRYQLSAYQSAPSLQYELQNNLNLSLSVSYKSQKNLTGNEMLQSTSVTQKTQWSKNDNTALISSLSYVKNDFKGDSFSVVGNTMLEGLRPKANWIWSLTWQQKLNNFLYLDFNYSGRKTHDFNAVHNANVQVRANF